MDDFKQHVWEWGYRHSASADDSSGSDDACAFESVNAVRIMPGGKTQYRCTKQGAESEWIQVEPSTAKSFHRLACSFLFRSIGVVSFHMGRMQLRHLLKHLNVDDVFQKGWEDFNEEAQASASKDGSNNNNEEAQAASNNNEEAQATSNDNEEAQVASNNNEEAQATSNDNEEAQATSGDVGGRESEGASRVCSKGEVNKEESDGNGGDGEKDGKEEEEEEAMEEEEEKGEEKEKEKEVGDEEMKGGAQDGDEVVSNGKEDGED
jgi:hypothetical protein